MKTIIRVITAFTRKLREDNIYASSTHAAYYIILSFFPFAMFLVTLLGYIPMFKNGLPQDWNAMLPDDVSYMIDLVLSEAHPSGTLLSITVVLALWSASVGMLSIMRGLNKIYGIRETRNYFVMRGISILYTLFLVAFLIVTLITFVLGNKLTDWFIAKIPSVGNIALLVISIRTTAGIGILLFFFLFMFCTVPNRKTTILKELPGALLTAVGWVGFSYLFSFYVNNMSNYAATYGSLTAIVICMLWLYFCMFIMYLGAELNASLANPVTKRALKRIRHKDVAKDDAKKDDIKKESAKKDSADKEPAAGES